RDALVHRVLLLPRRGLHLLEAGADDHLDVLAAQAAGGAAAVHGGVAAAQHDHPPADGLDVAEGDRGQPVDADVDVGRRLLPAGNVEIPSARCAGADEYRVVALFEQPLQAVDALAEPQLDAELGDVADFLVDHLFGQTEAGDLRADHAAALGLLVVADQLVAEG